MKTILVIDDDHDVRESVADALLAEGYAVKTAANGHEALAELAKLKDDPCLVLLDMIMPGMNGVELLRVLEHTHRLATLPVVVISGHAHAANGLGAQRLIRKPVSLDVLLAVVRDFCAEP